MKKSIIVVIISFIAFSCVSKYNSVKYDISLNKVLPEKMDSAKIAGPIYSDDNIFMVLSPDDKGIAFSLKNRTSQTAHIIWDQSVYVDENGTSMRIIHSGTKLINKGEPQPETIVVSGSSVEDRIVPSDNISWSGSDWHTQYLFAQTYKKDIGIQPIKDLYLNKSVKLLLLIKFGDTPREYQFEFLIKDITPFVK
jgi:hypothetical protein